ncbi:MAG TPA: hypothetical protein VFB62_18525 [Polyangiaceae bacterium]|jgi:hypothetical protein|nr:hypothetical protein [Polyangiaceae bacterium]
MFKFVAPAILVLVTSVPALAQEPPLDTSALTNNRYGKMEALVEKTFLQVNVASAKIRFDDQTARNLERLARGQEYSAERAERIARTAVKAQNAYAVVRFERDVPLDRFIKAVRQNLQRAKKAGMITEENYQHVSNQLPKWFGFLKQRGIKKGDRFLYRARPQGLRTVMVDSHGKEMLDQTDAGADSRLAMLSGYFAPGSDFRKPLIESLFED